jgi:hypothetical protein
MNFFKGLLPGARKRRAQKLANTVRDLIVGQQTATGLYAMQTKDGLPLNANTVLALATLEPTKEQNPDSDASNSDRSTDNKAQGRHVMFSGSTKAESREEAEAKMVQELRDRLLDQSDPSTTPAITSEKVHRKKHHKHRRHRHRHHKLHDKKRALKRQKALKQLQQPNTLSDVLDILRLMPNPFKTQSMMQQMFDHDWRSMSMPDLLAAERQTRRRQCNGSSCHDSDDDDENLPPEEMEARTYWWGYEIYIPPRTLQKLSEEGDIATAVLYFLGALSKTVPLIYPFVNMIATYVSMQFTIIKAADRGNGIILVATWVLPIVLIPKPWEDRFRETLRERIPIDL